MEFKQKFCCYAGCVCGGWGVADWGLHPGLSPSVSLLPSNSGSPALKGSYTTTHFSLTVTPEDSVRTLAYTGH